MARPKVTNGEIAELQLITCVRVSIRRAGIRRDAGGPEKNAPPDRDVGSESPGGSRAAMSWIVASDASQTDGDEVHIVGGANSAGQVVRGSPLQHTMSQYLIDKISSTPIIQVRWR